MLIPYRPEGKFLPILHIPDLGDPSAMASPAGPAMTPAGIAREGLPAAVAPINDAAGDAAGNVGADAVAIPSEFVHVLRAALPLPTQRQRRAAVGFAIEDQIAAPLEDTHVVIGPELAPGEYLVVAVSHRDMEDWASWTPPGMRLTPDVLGLPVPAAGFCSVCEAQGRVLARRADGTGYATRAALFEAFWRADGAPQVVLYGGELPEEIPVGVTRLLPQGAPGPAAAFDLFQGVHARSLAPRAWRRRLVAVAVLAVAAHGAILAGDTIALARAAEAREAALRSAIAARVPGLPPDLPLDVALRRALPPPPAADAGGFLPLLAEVSQALAPLPGLTLKSLGYRADDGLTLVVQAPDLPTLQRMEAALQALPVVATPGAAAIADGTAETTLRVRGAGG